MQTKADIVAQIATMLRVETPHMSTGSTEPREIFTQVNEVLALGLEPGLTKPELARAIAECMGLAWTPTCESSGGTVTREGLGLVRDAVAMLVG
jgi:hypothetical protein